LMKWQGWEKKTKIIRSCRFIASRIPLSFDKKNLSGTLKYLERSCCNLNDLNLIKGFNFTKTKPLSNSNIEFELFTTHDHDLLGDNKQKLICMTNQPLAVETGHECLQIENEDEFIELTEKVAQEAIDIKPSNISVTSREPSQLTFDSIHEIEPSKELSGLFNLLPPEHREKETIRAIIHKCSQKFGLDYVKRNIEYSNKNSKTNYRAYLVEALKNDYGLELQEDKKQEQKNNIKIKEGMKVEFLDGRQFKIEPGLCIHPNGYDGGCVPEGTIITAIKEGRIKVISWVSLNI